ncbi:MAG: hypothetical protein LBD51_00150 [Bifidobacteriaceae bacterium]|jgi:alternate signal-mediated exported protein|nr:hypothetical protein [Bifidobacteriaceae bacterium]
MTTGRASRSSGRVKGIVAGVAGVALLLGGSTFALWSASTKFETIGTINTGQMKVEPVADGVKAYDVSPDRANSADGVANEIGVPGQGIDLATAQMVPGDMFAIALPFQVTMSGDNLVGRLSLFGTSESEKLPGGSYQVALFNGTTLGDGHDWTPGSTDPVTLGLLAKAGGEDAGQGSAGGEVTALPEDGQIKVVVFVTFDQGLTDSQHMSLNKVLKGITVQLDQVRTVNAGDGETVGQFQPKPTATATTEP